RQPDHRSDRAVRSGRSLLMAATTLLHTPAAGQLGAQGAGGEQLVELGLDAHRADRATLVHHSLAELVDHVRRRADRIPAYRTLLAFERQPPRAVADHTRPGDALLHE